MTGSTLLDVDEALARVLAAAKPIGFETVPLSLALQRVLAADVHSRHPLPLFTQSAVDGYAVRHADLGDLPVSLALGAPVAARAQARHPLLVPGTALRILTGGVLPQGADTVVRQERTRREAEQVTVLEPVDAGADIRHQGEEMQQGATVAAAGSVITPGLIGALALAGLYEVSVWKLPRIVVLVSGDEVVRDRAPLQLGQVPDANGPLLRAYLAQWGMAPLRIEAVADTQEAVSRAMSAAFADADLVLTTGGVSVGDHDYIPAVAESLGAERLLWKVAQKPGMPLYVARRGCTLLFGLPGNPASVLVNLIVYIRAALDAMQGRQNDCRWRPAPIRLDPGRADPVKTLWLRASESRDETGQPTLKILRGQASHMLGNLAEANALLRLDPKHQARPVQFISF